MNKKCQVLMYDLIYKQLTLKLQKENEETYKYALMELILQEYNNKFFVVNKINKPTKNGTKVKYIKIENKEKARDKIIEVGKNLKIKLSYQQLI